MPYTPTFASSTATVCSRRPSVAVAAETNRTASVDSTSPSNDSEQNGTSCPKVGRRPPWDHTQRRFSSKDGTVPAAVATTFAHIAGKESTPTSTPSTVTLVRVETTDTEAYFTSRRAKARRCSAAKRREAMAAA